MLHPLSIACLHAVRIVVAYLLVFGMLWTPAALGDNTGLGPLTIGGQFQPWQQFLNYTPTSLKTLAQGTLQVRYQFSITNSFSNTQTPRFTKNKFKITNAELKEGLAPKHFPSTGYGLFLDVESYRHLLRIDYGLLPNLQVALEWPWHTFGGGGLDHNTERVEHIFSSINRHRTAIARDQYQIFIVRDGEPIQVGQTPFQRLPGEPVARIKWQWSEGNDNMPAMGMELSYKHPRKVSKDSPAALVNSGGADYGLSLLLAKKTSSFWNKPIIVHFQTAYQKLTVKPHTFSNQRWHLMVGGEMRFSQSQSVVIQTSAQNSLFESTTTKNRYLSSPSFLVTVGYHLQALPWLLEVGFIEDYFQRFNELDVSGYVQTGFRW